MFRSILKQLCILYSVKHLYQTSKITKNNEKQKKLQKKPNFFFNTLLPAATVSTDEKKRTFAKLKIKFYYLQQVFSPYL